jgi:hypothetical protein
LSGISAIASAKKEMTFRYSIRLLPILVAGAIAFPLLAILSVVVGLTDSSVANPVQFTLLTGGVFGFMTFIAALSIVEHRRYELRIEGNRVAQRGLIRQTSIALTPTTEAEWRWPRPRIVLRTANEQLKIDLTNFDRADKLSLIRFFRNKIPADRQRNWDGFASKVAIRLRDQIERRDRPLAPGEFLYTRRQWDRFFLLLIPILVPAFAVAAIFVFRETGNLDKILFAPAGPLVLWLVIRFSIPPQGERTKRISSVTGTWFACFIVCSLALMLADLVASAFGWPYERNSTAEWVILSVWTCAIVIAVFCFGRQQRRRDREEAALAAEKWEIGEAAQPDRASQFEEYQP